MTAGDRSPVDAVRTLGHRLATSKARTESSDQNWFRLHAIRESTPMIRIDSKSRELGAMDLYLNEIRDDDLLSAAEECASWPEQIADRRP